jgi:hypothetical protein
VSVRATSVDGRPAGKATLPPRRRQRYRETPEVVAATRRLVRVVGKRIATEDPPDLLLLAELEQEVRRAKRKQAELIVAAVKAGKTDRANPAQSVKPRNSKGQLQGQSTRDPIKTQVLEEAAKIAWEVAVQGIRRSGFTDREIGEALGTTRQAVEQRWPRT